jgi:membrane protein required for colicin V production
MVNGATQPHHSTFFSCFFEDCASMIGPLSYLDIGLLALAFVSGLLAMYRGFAREVLSIVSWGVAAGGALYVFLKQEAFANEITTSMSLPHPMIARAGLTAMVFLITLVVVHLVTSRMSDAILDSRIGVIDRVLGFLFGAARGFMIVLIPYMFWIHYGPPTEAGQPEWVRRSIFRSTLDKSKAALTPPLQAIVEKLSSKAPPEQ